MKPRSLAAALAASLMLTTPLAVAAPAGAKPATTPCVRITAPGSQTVAVGESVTVHVRLSRACRSSYILFDGQPPMAPGRRHTSFSMAWYVAGQQAITVHVVPMPPSRGKFTTRTFTYNVEVK